MLLRFAASFLEGTNLLDGFVRHLAGVRVMLNTSKTLAFTTGARPPSFTFLHPNLVQPPDQGTSLVIPHRTNGLVACCALALHNDQGFRESNVDCAISKQLFLPQLASLQSTGRYTENTCTNMTFNSEIRRIVGRPPARIGQRNGMLFCVSGKCVWITKPVPVELPPGQRSV